MSDLAERGLAREAGVFFRFGAGGPDSCLSGSKKWQELLEWIVLTRRLELQLRSAFGRLVRIRRHSENA